MTLEVALPWPALTWSVLYLRTQPSTMIKDTVVAPGPLASAPGAGSDPTPDVLTQRDLVTRLQGISVYLTVGRC